MPLHNFQAPRGRIERFEIDSRALRGNLLGDPPRRSVWVYLPEGVDGGQRYPLFVDLVGFTGSGPKHLAWRAFDESVPQKIDRLVEEGAMGEVIVAFPDCFTSLGGNQYVDSRAMGHWAEFLVAEMLPELEARFPCLGGAAHRAVFGKSSGGYGAIMQALLHGEHWGAVACHSGDMGFELCYAGDFPEVLDALAAAGGLEAFLSRVEGRRKMSGKDLHLLMTLAMAATYDPDPESPRGIRLPVDPHTCERIPERWQNWLAHDPVELVERADCQERLRGLKALYVDCGDHDQYHLHYGARRFAARLSAHGIPHTYEEFDDDHSSVDYRMDQSLPALYRALMG